MGKNLFNGIVLRGLLFVFVFATPMFWPSPGRVIAAAGDLDATFGNGGKITTDFFGLLNEASDIVLQQDGKIIAAGYTQTFTTDDDFALVRYNSDGSLDTTFASGGTLTTDFFGGADQVKAVALQPDGKIVVAGSTVSPSRFTDFAFARYDSDGSLDTSFGIGGKVTVSFLDRFSQATDLALQSDGSIVAVGHAFHSGDFTFAFALARLNQDGSLDPSFGSGGMVITNFFASDDEFNADDQAEAVAIQTDGKIIAGGRTRPPGGQIDFGLARYNRDGSLDETFGAGGKVITDFSNSTDVARDLAIQQDGRIVAAGVGGSAALEGDFVLARYDTNGNLDNSFGNGGKVATDFFNRTDGALSVAIEPDNKIVAAGAATDGARKGVIGLARYNSNGSLDASFGDAGKVTSDISTLSSIAQAVALQTDGKVVVGGIATTQETNSDFAVVRYAGDQRFDLCLQGENGDGVLQINSTTGDYLFSDCDGRAITGTGAVSARGCNLSLRDTATDRRIIANVNTCSNRATASIQLLSVGVRFNITDRNTANNSCTCQ
jgi:uncharacterized delta-60 repeat protein